MQVSIYLHQDILNELAYYGDLDNVVDQILTLGERGAIDLEDRPPCRPRANAKRVTVNIHNRYYITLLRTYPAKSSRISLRRILYWFVENDMCTLLNTETITDEEQYERLYIQVLDIVHELVTLQQTMSETYTRCKYDKINRLLQHTGQAINILEEL